MTEFLKTVVMLGIDPMMKRRERNRKKSNPLEVETALGNKEEFLEENENIGLMDKSFMHEEDLETEGDRDATSATLDIRIRDNLHK